MKWVWGWAVVCMALSGADTPAQAQEGPGPEERLKQEFEKRREELHQRLRKEMEALEKGFRHHMEELEKNRPQKEHAERREEPGRPQEFENAVRRLAHAIEELRKEVEGIKREMHERRGGPEEQHRCAIPNAPKIQRLGPEACPCKGKCEHCHPDLHPRRESPQKEHPRDRRDD